MAQAIITLISGYVQLIVDNSANTATLQWYNGSGWTTVATLGLNSNTSLSVNNGSNSLNGTTTIETLDVTTIPGFPAVSAGLNMTGSGGTHGAVLDLTAIATSSPYMGRSGNFHFPNATAGDAWNVFDNAGNPVLKVLVDGTKAVALDATLSVANAATLSDTLAVTGAVTAGGVNPSNAVTSIAGTTAGTIYWVMPFQGSGYKKAIVFLDAYENDTATAQTITYPTAFVQVPNVTNPGAVPGVSTTATTLSIDPDTTTAYTAWLVVEGY